DHPRREKTQQRQWAEDTEVGFPPFARADQQRRASPEPPGVAVEEPRKAEAMHHPPGLQDRFEPVDQYKENQEDAEEGEEDHVGFSPVKAAGRPARFPTRARRRRTRERGAAARGGRNAPAPRCPAKTRAPPAS